MTATLALLLAMAAAFAAIAWLAVRTGRRMVREGGRLRLLEAVRGQGLEMPPPLSERGVHAAASAARRCAACAAHERCDALLAARDWRSLREICPNSAYLDSLRG